MRRPWLTLTAMKRILLLTVFSASFLVYAQTENEQKAHDLAMKAIEEMDNGKIDESIEMLQECVELDPDNVSYPYEIAYAYYQKQNYTEANKRLKKIMKDKNASDRFYQLYGNTFDFLGKPEKAIQVYEKGLEIFPNSGILHLERGNMELGRKEYGKALAYYEKGVEVDPFFPSNYYWCSKIFLSSTEEVWGMIYGELFLNLERNTKRTEEISKRMYDTYKNEIEFSGPVETDSGSTSSVTVSFSQNNVIDASSLKDGEFKLPFSMVYETLLSIGVATADSIDLHSLSRARQAFIEQYYKMEHEKNYPIVLFDYQHQVLEMGYMEPYNYWILFEGNRNAAKAWIDDHSEEWEEFIDWFSKNPIEITMDNRFYRAQC